MIRTQRYEGQPDGWAKVISRAGGSVAIRLISRDLKRVVTAWGRGAPVVCVVSRDGGGSGSRRELAAKVGRVGPNPEICGAAAADTVRALGLRDREVIAVGLDGGAVPPRLQFSAVDPAVAGDGWPRFGGARELEEYEEDKELQAFLKLFAQERGL
jgi:hypothetical protein